MFDYLKIHKSHLSDNLKDYENGWQTKSHDCYLLNLMITEDGKLLIDKNFFGKEEKLEETNYTGEIRANNIINKERVEIVAFFENGQMLKLIEIK